MINNPLTILILQILKNNKTEISEYDLIQQLEESGIEFPQEESTELSLFKKHFLIMNALYALQNDLIDDGYFLSVTPLVIKMKKMVTLSDTKDLIDHTDKKLSEYYLDWQIYEDTSQQNVNDLLNGFWEKFSAVDKKLEALKILGLEADVNKDQLVQAYRRLAAKHHPDKGGNDEDFIKLREAYEILKFCF